MIPVNTEIQEILGSFDHGNFGLWFNKFVKLEEKKGVYKTPDNAIKSYVEKYNSIKHNIKELVKEKHILQYYLCESFSNKYEILTIRAKLKTPLVTGIGQTHPIEVGMTFDHTIGIPYIPATTIKGIVRFAHILNLIENLENDKIKKDKDGNEYFDLAENWTHISELFGKSDDKGNIGRVIFLDAYPENVPELYADVMTPHYGTYYADSEAPGDYIEPKPIGFLAINKNNNFIFRVLINKEKNKLDNNKTILSLIKDAFKKVLTEEGIGAKTAVGYGRFEDVSYKEPHWVEEGFEKKYETEEQKFAKVKNKLIERIKNAEKESREIDAIFDAWQNDDRIKDDKDIASYFKDKVKKKKANKEYTHQYQVIADILDLELGNDVPKEEKSNSNDTQLENEYEEAKKKIVKAKGNEKKINKILKGLKSSIRNRLKEELGL